MTRRTFLAGFFMLGIAIWGAPEVPATTQGVPSSGQAPGEIITLKIKGMTCASCAGDIRKALLGVPGVKRADVSYAQGGAIVEVEPGRATHEQLIRAVASAGNILSSYRATVVPNGTLTTEAAEQGGLWSRFLNFFK